MVVFPCSEIPSSTDRYLSIHSSVQRWYAYGTILPSRPSEPLFPSLCPSCAYRNNVPRAEEVPFSRFFPSVSRCFWAGGSSPRRHAPSGFKFLREHGDETGDKTKHTETKIDTLLNGLRSIGRERDAPRTRIVTRHERAGGEISVQRFPTIRTARRCTYERSMYVIRDLGKLRI